MPAYTFRGIQMPTHLKESLDAYVQQGRPLGSFLEAVIENDLRNAVGRADEESLAALGALVGFLYNHAPMGSWGFKGAHDKWVEKKRMEREK